MDHPDKTSRYIQLSVVKHLLSKNMTGSIWDGNVSFFNAKSKMAEAERKLGASSEDWVWLLKRSERYHPSSRLDFQKLTVRPIHVERLHAVESLPG